MEVAKRAVQSSVREGSAYGSGVNYLVKGPGGLIQQMDFAVTWAESGDGKRKVTLKVGNFITRQTTFLFIPVAPKSVPALGSLRKFSEAMRRELAS